MKLCKNCVHYRPAGAVALFGYSWDRACRAPQQMHVDPVEGGMVYDADADRDPGKLRAEGGACGPDAGWFELKLLEPETTAVPSALDDLTALRKDWEKDQAEKARSVPLVLPVAEDIFADDLEVPAPSRWRRLVEGLRR